MMPLTSRREKHGSRISEARLKSKSVTVQSAPFQPGAPDTSYVPQLPQLKPLDSALLNAMAAVVRPCLTRIANMSHGLQTGVALTYVSDVVVLAASTISVVIVFAPSYVNVTWQVPSDQLLSNTSKAQAVVLQP